MLAQFSLKFWPEYGYNAPLLACWRHRLYSHRKQSNLILRLPRHSLHVSPSRVQANIEKLVSFGTRLTLSAQDADSIKQGRGIGAAREWIKSEFETLLESMRRMSRSQDGQLSRTALPTASHSRRNSPMFMRC